MTLGMYQHLQACQLQRGQGLHATIELKGTVINAENAYHAMLATMGALVKSQIQHTPVNKHRIC